MKNEGTEPAKAFFSRHDPAVLKVLRRSVVGIAGAGGLGSNVAVALTRAGVGKLIIADSDLLEISNLNRQQYFWKQVGRVKVEALAENLRKIHPFADIVVHRRRITKKNIARLFGEVDLLVEAFDRAAEKQMLIESWLAAFPDRPIIAASGLAGYGRNQKIHQRRVGNLYIVGDEGGECCPGISPMAPRVGVVAHMQANLAVELLMKRNSGEGKS
jgi:sulfur carrier protein ThiS adenylyltransferase